jgi:hypothetical protein
VTPQEHFQAATTVQQVIGLLCDYRQIDAGGRPSLWAQIRQANNTYNSGQRTETDKQQYAYAIDSVLINNGIEAIQPEQEATGVQQPTS